MKDISLRLVIFFERTFLLVFSSMTEGIILVNYIRKITIRYANEETVYGSHFVVWFFSSTSSFMEKVIKSEDGLRVWMKCHLMRQPAVEPWPSILLFIPPTHQWIPLWIGRVMLLYLARLGGCGEEKSARARERKSMRYNKMKNIMSASARPSRLRLLSS